MLDQSKLKAYADGILNVTQITVYVLDAVEISDKGENAAYQRSCGLCGIELTLYQTTKFGM